MRTTIRKLIILLFLTAGTAHSAEWKAEPVLELATGYNDNIRMAIEDEISSTDVTFSPSTTFSVVTPKSGLSGDLRFDFRRFKEDSNLDDNNTRFELNSYHRLERSQFGLNAAIIKDTTLDSQLEDTGLVFGRVKRLELRGGPRWTYNISEYMQASLNYSYSDIQYLNADGTGFVDFSVHSGQASLQRVLNERTTATTTLSYSQTDNDNDAESRNINLRGGASHQFSETLSASGSVGVRRTETDFSQNTLVPIFAGDIIIGFVPLAEDVSNSSSGYTFSANLNKAFLRGSTGITASRNISTSTNGAPVEVTQLGWNNQYNLTEILTAYLSVQLYSSQTENSVSTNLNREYYEITPSATWKFDRLWSVTGSYRYTQQTFDNTSGDATRNVANLTLTYRWPRIAVSR